MDGDTLAMRANIEERWQEFTKILDRGPSQKHPLIYEDMQANGFDAFCFGILEVMDTQVSSLLNRQAEYWRNLFQPEYNQSQQTGSYALSTENGLLLEGNWWDED